MTEDKQNNKPDEDKSIPEEMAKYLMTADYEDLPEDVQAYFRERASVAFADFDTGVKFNKSGSVTVTPDAQARIVFNALSHRHQGLFLASVLAKTFVTLMAEYDDLSEQGRNMLDFVSGVLPPEMVVYHAMHNVVVGMDGEEVN